MRSVLWCVCVCTGDRCFKEIGAGLLNVLMRDCVTNAFYVMISLLVEIV